ncbi:MAG: hypothetical protein JMN27_18160 [gamma proteobacterium endosymbiont of Lamellibrachia anaximandri]|nr:hypothetical protein [gamma proteobacterium endosymbiont of Lamellibrachia anaximandri]MBL3535729.1 hypothetical protein [gamma proteobacterium endosymbiont of Lamellibrachia anaximandri]
MEQPWTIASLSDWAIKAGLQPRLLGAGNGVIVSPTDERKALFSICLDGVAPENCVEIAINRDNIRALSLQELLQEQYEIDEPEAAHKWPRIGLPDYLPSVLQSIAEWAEERVLTSRSPAPQPLALNNTDAKTIQEGSTSGKSQSRSAPAPVKSGGINKWLSGFLSARGMARPDGRPLYAYKTTDEELLRVTKQLQLLAMFRGHRIFSKDRKFDGLFVLFAAEWWRREYHGGPWAWLPIYEAVGLNAEAITALQTSPQQHLYPALERGFQYWKREIFSMGQGRTFIGSIAAEGGLPLNLLSDPHAGLKRFFKHLLDRYLPVRASGIPASQIASELQNDLPTSFCRETVFRVAGEIVEATLELRTQYGLSDQDNPVAHLDRVYPEWRDRFPLSLDNEPAKTLLRALVVDAAKRGDTGLPVALSRNIIKEADGTYQLQAGIDMARKLSITSLSQLFGEIEWPSQLEIWLIRPFKARLAVLSGIDAEHFKVRNFGVSWKGCDAADEAAVGLFSYGSQLGEVREVPESLMEDQLPWVFVEKDSRLAYLSQGGVSLATESATLVIANEMSVLSDDETLECLGEIKGVDRAIYQGSGLIRVRSEDGVFSIRTHQSKLEIPHYALMGHRLYKDANVRQVYLGAPKLFRRDAGGGRNTLQQSVVQWRPAGSGDIWQIWSTRMQGIVDIRAVDGKEILFRTRVAVLPEKTEFSITPGGKRREGDIIVSGLPDVRFAAGVEGLGVDVSTDESGTARLHLTQIDERRSTFPLHIQWPSLQQSLQLIMPVPVAGARFRDGSGHWLDDRSFISVSDLAGIHAMGFNHCDGAPERLYLDINIRGSDLRSSDVRSLTDRIPLPRMGQISELPLIQLRERFLQLFSLSEDLDCRIELTIEGNRTYGRLQLARYMYQLNPVVA